MSEVHVETVEEFLARGGMIEVLPASPDIVEGRVPEVLDMDVGSKYAAWKAVNNG